MASPTDWSPSSWRSFPIKQQPQYTDPEKLQSALDELRRLPPLVTPAEVDSLRAQLAEVAQGRRFLLQGGDCAERFMDCSAEPIEKKMKILLQMSLVLTWGARIPTLRIARMAGQFSKPRSSNTEIINGQEVLSFRGDNINSFDASNRAADPARLVSGYFHSAATLNYARALLASGFADLQNSTHWDLGFVQHAGHRAQYQSMADRILSSLDFMRVCGVAEAAALKTADVFMSHEGLQLDLEEALTRPVPVVGHRGAGEGPSGRALSPRPAASKVQRRRSSSHNEEGGDIATPVHPPAAHSHSSTSGAPAPIRQPATPRAQAFYNLGAHFLWIGDRTRQMDHAHVEYFRGVANPVGVKAGPTSDPDELVRVIKRLWPDPAAQPGKIVIITRMGAAHVRTKLAPLVKAVQAAGFSAAPVWVCDPMHGNTRTSSNGFKTREFDDILTELKGTFEVHRALGSHLGGVHFELTGENVTECTGGPERLLEADLPLRYTTYCDPRLNYGQGMELAFLIAQFLADEREEALAAASGLSPSAFIDSTGDAGGRIVPLSSRFDTRQGGTGAHAAEGGSTAGEEGEGAAEGDKLGDAGPGVRRNSSRSRFAPGRGLSPEPRAGLGGSTASTEAGSRAGSR